MKFFFFSLNGESLFLALQVEREGNDVTFFMVEPNEKSDGVPGKGLIRKLLVGPPDNSGIDSVTSFVKSRIDRDTIVVFDMVSSKRVKAGAVADRLRKAGYFVIGASEFADAIELNRAFGAQIMRAAGIKIPKSASFKDFAEGIKFARDNPEFLVFKPHGNIGTGKSLVAEDIDEFTHDLEAQASHWKGPIEFELQEKVSGIEVSIEGWFNGNEWIHHSINSTIEEKKLMFGGLGPNTGCMGNTVWFWRHSRPKIFKDTLNKLTTILRKVNYRGPLDVNTKGGYGLEFTARFGYDALQAMIQLMRQDVGRFLSDVAMGQVRQIKPSFEFATAVRLSVPPYPHEFETEGTYGLLVRVDPSILSHFMVGDVCLDKGELVVAGTDGAIGSVTATHASLSELNKLVYERVEKVQAQDLQYRTDILTHRALKDIPILLKEAV